jgi:hypothetical protein
MDLSSSHYLFLAGISFLGSSVISVGRMDFIKKSLTLTSALYFSSTIFIVWGLYKFGWYLVLLPVWVGSYYFYFLRRIVWIRLYLNGKSGLENINWDNIYIILGITISLIGLLIE